jgi:hypothetical protein
MTRRSQSRRSRAPKERVCPNPLCPDTAPRLVADLSGSGRREAPPAIKARLDAHLNYIKRCGYCGVVYLFHGPGQRERVGYFNAPTAHGWQSYPPDIEPPRD